MNHEDTIFALSSGSLPSGVAIVRISGPQVRHIAKNMCGFIPEPRYASFLSIRNQNNLKIDQALVLFFPAPNSFTGEDCLEFQLHGGRAVVDACYRALAEFDGCRLAEAGEFSKRAFDNGKIDLTAAEGLADLIAAETQSQLKIALEQSDGGLRNLYVGWSRRILKNRALIEAEIDFADEDDIPGSVSDQVWHDVSCLIDEINTHLLGERIGEIGRDGYSVVIVGAPNAGKSTLINRLAGRDVAIVSSEAGTTRDILEVRLDLDGQLVIVKDTAGMRVSDDLVEQEGVKRAKTAMESADLVLHLIDPTKPEPAPLSLEEKEVISVFTKVDLHNYKPRNTNEFVISAQENKGVDVLLDAISTRVRKFLQNDQMLVPTRRRYIENLQLAIEELRLALNMGYADLELRTEHLRRAQILIDRITGQTDVEDLLGVIFGEFCVGK